MASCTVAWALVAAALAVSERIQRVRNPLHMRVLEAWARRTVGEWSALPEASSGNDRVVESTVATPANRSGVSSGLITQLQRWPNELVDVGCSVTKASEETCILGYSLQRIADTFHKLKHEPKLRMCT